MASANFVTPLGTTKHTFTAKKQELESEARAASITIMSRDSSRVLLPDVQATMCLYHMEVQESLWPVLFPVIRHLVDNRKLVLEELYAKLGLGQTLTLRHILLDGIITHLKDYMREHDDHLPGTVESFLAERAATSPVASPNPSPRLQHSESNPAGSPMSVDTAPPVAVTPFPTDNRLAHTPPHSRDPLTTPPAPIKGQSSGSHQQAWTTPIFEFSLGSHGTTSVPQRHGQYNQQSSPHQQSSPQHQSFIQQQQQDSQHKHNQQSGPQQHAGSQYQPFTQQRQQASSCRPGPQHQSFVQQQQYYPPPMWPSPSKQANFRGDVVLVKSKEKVLDAVRLLNDQFFDPEPCCDGLAIGKVAHALANLQLRLGRARDRYQEEYDEAFEDFSAVVKEVPHGK